MTRDHYSHRPPPSRISSVFPVADTLLGAAHSDEVVVESEQQTVREILCQILHVDKLHERVEARLQAFDPRRLNMALVNEEIDESGVVGRRTLMEMTRDVCDADGQIDLREDRFMLALAVAMSMQTEEYDDLVFDSPFRGWKRVTKRFQDIVLGMLFLLVSALPMLFVALAIKLTSRGPVFFRQRRYGEDGREFDMIKFRSMTVAENSDDVKQAKRNDPRVTKVGKFIRRTSLDELPQFINVLKGDMSVVGPRPHAVAHNEKYRKEILEYMRRHKVKPGITGWAQINGYRGETDTLEKMIKRVEHDIYYIRNWRFWFDIRIIWMTVFGKKARQNAY